MCMLWGDLYNTFESLNAVHWHFGQNKTNFSMYEYNPMDFPLSADNKLFSSHFILPILCASDLILFPFHQGLPYPGFINQKKHKTIKLDPGMLLLSKNHAAVTD